MKKNGVFGLIAGITAGVAAAVAGSFATVKIVKEIKSDLNESCFVSPDGDNFVTLKCGASNFAKGLAYIKVRAYSESEVVNDECTFSFLAGKNANGITFEWKDNNHFELSVGEGKLKQCCDISFNEGNITIMYFLQKDEEKVPAETIEVVSETEADVEATAEKVEDNTEA